MKKTFYLVALSLIFSTTNFAFANNEEDWMIDGSGYKAQIIEKGQDVVLTNGLIERIFRNGTTIRLNNLMTGEGMLRSVRPEAEIVLDNMTIPIGGMTGQVVHNYILEEWFETMQADTMALRCVGHKTEAIKPRFTWNPRKEWMSSNPAWPAKGKELIFTYKADNALIKRIENLYAKDDKREVIVDADFTTTMPNGWKIVTSKSNAANTFGNEGKPGEILVPANSSSYAESNIPTNTEVLVARINPGTDKSTNWGPGLAWIFNNKTIKLYIRTAEAEFGVTGLGIEYEKGLKGYRPGEAVTLKMQRVKGKIICSYSYDEKAWIELGKVELPANATSQAVKIGKMDVASKNGEDKLLGDAGRCRVDYVKAMGALTKSKKQTEFDYLKNVCVNVHYEIYDGIPMISKWISVDNQSNRSVLLNSYKSEILAVTEPDNASRFEHSFMTPNITIESDFSHCREYYPNNPRENLATERHVDWIPDPLYKTQTNWLLQIPCLLESEPQYGPAVDIASEDSFNSHRIWELYHDSRERVRKSLQVRKMYRIASPWIAENPIFMHVRSADNESVKKAIDQCAEVGFEMVIMTFWSGVNIEDNSPENLKRMKELADYTHSKGIALGGYSLLGSRSIDEENDVIMPEGKRAQFGHSPCLGSKWGKQYMHNIENYFKVTGQDILEHDGSYPGDECASTHHPGHKGLEDSQWKQFKMIQGFYQRCKESGVFLNVPDWYFMNGQNKTCMGYREGNWSLPRKQQELIERQNIYDGTWNKTPSMGWMMVPLTQYHGGGEAATIEPLKEHLPHYELRLADNFGAGVIACYRGPQLYDAPETKAMVKKWVDFYKSHRAILDSDIVHLRRPDGTDWDGFLHVNPELKEKGLLMVYNPLKKAIKKEIKVPLYYTGLRNKATVKSADGKVQTLKLDQNQMVHMEIEIPAYYCNWYVFE